MIYNRAVLPMTATNFYNMQKGRYQKSATPSVFNRANPTTKSLNLLNAYGELAAASVIEEKFTRQ